MIFGGRKLWWGTFGGGEFGHPENLVPGVQLWAGRLLMRKQKLECPVVSYICTAPTEGTSGVTDGGWKVTDGG